MCDHVHACVRMDARARNTVRRKEVANDVMTQTLLLEIEARLLT